MDTVVDSAGDVELIAAGREGETEEGIRYLQNLLLPKIAMSQIEDEDILVRIGRDPMALIVVEPVIAAGKNQQRIIVGTHRRLDRLTDGIARKISKSRVEF